MQAEGEPPLRILPEREFHLVAIVEPIGRRKRLVNRRVGKAADAPQGLDHLAALVVELQLVRQVLPPAAAAQSEVLAPRLDPVGRWSHDFDRAPLGVVASHAIDPDLDGVSRDGPVHEHHETLHAPDTLAAEGEVVNADIPEYVPS